MFAEFILYLKDKAHWNDDNTHVFCTLAVEHKRRGFTSKGSMTKRGFLSMAPQFQARTGLRHSVDQLRNRWNQLNIMYAWYKAATKHTGVGVAADGQLSAEQWWWDQHTKVVC